MSLGIVALCLLHVPTQGTYKPVIQEFLGWARLLFAECLASILVWQDSVHLLTHFPIISKIICDSLFSYSKKKLCVVLCPYSRHLLACDSGVFWVGKC